MSKTFVDLLKEIEKGVPVDEVLERAFGLNLDELSIQRLKEAGNRKFVKQAKGTTVDLDRWRRMGENGIHVAAITNMMKVKNVDAS